MQRFIFISYSWSDDIWRREITSQLEGVIKHSAPDWLVWSESEGRWRAHWVFRDQDRNPVQSVAFDADGSWLASGNWRGDIRIHAVQPKALAIQLCGLVSRDMDEREWREFTGFNALYQEHHRCLSVAAPQLSD